MDNKQYVDSLLVAIEVDTSNLIQETERAIKSTSTKLETLPKVGIKVGKELGESLGENTRNSIKKIDIGKSLITSFNSAIDNIKKTIAGSKPIEVKTVLTVDSSALKSYSAEDKGRRRGYYNKLGSEIPFEDELEYKKRSISFTQQRMQNLRTGQSDKLTTSEKSIFPKQQVKESNIGIDNLANSMKVLKENTAGVVNSFRDFAVGKVGIEEVGNSVLKLVSNVTPLQVAFVAVGAVIVQQMKLVGEAISQVWALMDPKMLQEKGVATASQFEQFETKFEVFLGSAEKAKSRIAEYAEFGSKTPFNLPEIVEAGKLLQQFGGDALATGDNLTMVGDMASASGRSFQEVGMWVARAYSSMKSGRPFGEAAMRLQELGLLSGEARNKLESLQKSGASFDEQWGAFTETMGQFSGMMEKQSHTMEGLTSNIEDFGQQMALVGGTPLFDQKKAGLETWYNWLEDNKDVLKQISLAIGGIKAAWNSFAISFKENVIKNLDLDTFLIAVNNLWEALGILSASFGGKGMSSTFTNFINEGIDGLKEMSIDVLELSITVSQLNAMVKGSVTHVQVLAAVWGAAFDSMTGKAGQAKDIIGDLRDFMNPAGFGKQVMNIASGKGIFGIGKFGAEAEKEKAKQIMSDQIKDISLSLEKEFKDAAAREDKGVTLPINVSADLQKLQDLGVLTKSQVREFNSVAKSGEGFEKALYNLQAATLSYTSQGEDFATIMKKAELATLSANLAFTENAEEVEAIRAEIAKLKNELENPPKPEEVKVDAAWELAKAQLESEKTEILKYSAEMIEIKQGQAKKEEALLKDHNDNLAEIQKDGVKEQQQIEEDNLEKQEEMAEDYYKKQQDILKDADEKLYKLRQKGDLEERRQKQNHDRDMKKLDESYMYDLTETVKNRDAQAIVDLRRKHEQETEEKIENYDFEKQRRAEDRALEAEEIQIDRQKRLEDLDLEIQERAIKLQEEHDKELLALEEKLNEQTLKENEAYKIQQQQLDDALKTKLESIATELAKVPGMTDEMANQVLMGLANIFGIDGDIASMMKDFRSQLEIQSTFTHATTVAVARLVPSSFNTGPLDTSAYLGGATPEGPSLPPGYSYDPSKATPSNNHIDLTRIPNGGSIDTGNSCKMPSAAVNATGGIRIANKPTLLMVGEAGPELFTAAPLSSLSTLKNMNKDNGSKGVGGKLQIEFMGSAPPGLGARERDQIASVLLSAIKETGILQ